MSTSPKFLQIQQFLGIQQQYDGGLLPAGSARDCRNVDTSDGDLRVAKGYTAVYDTAIAGTDKILRLIPFKGADVFYAVTTEHIYKYSSSSWTSIYTFSPALTTKQIGYTQLKIGTSECVLVATGETQIIKIDYTNSSVSLFGTGATCWTGTVSNYDSSTLTVTLSSNLNAEQARHAIVDGLNVGDANLLVSSATSGSASVVLKEEPEEEPESGDAATIRGGGSTAPVNYLGKYYKRLIACGDASNPCRLYWSAVPGEGRTAEDWLAVTGSADASGGYVDVGEESGDKIVGVVTLPTYVLIFKRYTTWRLYGDRPSTFVLECLDNSAEAMSNSGCTCCYSTPYWMTKTGLKSANESSCGAADGGVHYLREFLQTVYSFADSKATVCDNILYFTCKVTEAAVYDDLIVTFNLVTGAIILRDGFQCADIIVRDGKLYMIDGNRKLCLFNDGTSYNGSPIDAYWISQPMDLGAKYLTKQITEIHARCDDGGDVDIVVNGDNVKRTIPRLLHGDKSGYIAVPIKIDKARVFSFEFHNRNGSQFHFKGGIDIRYEREMTP